MAHNKRLATSYEAVGTTGSIVSPGPSSVSMTTSLAQLPPEVQSPLLSTVQVELSSVPGLVVNTGPVWSSTTSVPPLPSLAIAMVPVTPGRSSE